MGAKTGALRACAAADEGRVTVITVPVESTCVTAISSWSICNIAGIPTAGAAADGAAVVVGAGVVVVPATVVVGAGVVVVPASVVVGGTVVVDAGGVAVIVS